MYRATKALIAINAIMGLLAMVGFSYSIAVVAQNGKLCLDCLAIPVIWAWAAFGLTLGIVLVSIFAIVAAYKHSKSMLIFMSLFTFVSFAASVVLTVIVLMWSSAADFGVLNPTITGLENQLKSFLAEWAVEHPQDWVGIQNDLHCCGVDFRALYVVESAITFLHTGEACNSTIDAQLADTRQANPDFSVFDQNPLVLQLLNAGVIIENGGKPYFCDQAVRSAAQRGTIVAGIVLSFLSALQLVAFSLSCYLLCGVSKEDGGFAEIDEETGKLQSPLKAFIQAPGEVAHDTKAFANRVSTRIGMNVAPVANRVSMRMGFSPMFSPPSSMPPISGPPPGMPPPGMGPPGMGGNPVVDREMNGGGGGQKDFGEKYAKYVRMKKSGLPIGAVRNAMERDQVPIPDGFFDEDEGGDDASPSKPPPPAKKGFGGPPAGPPPFQAMRNLASRLSMNVAKTSNRVSMNMRGMFGGGGFSPPPPPPGFGELPPEGMSNSFAGSSPFGGATPNPGFGPGKFSTQTVPEEFAAPALPPAPKAAPPPKAAPAPKKEAPPPKAKKAAAKKGGGGGGGGGGAGFLADIASAGGSSGPSAFGLKKTVTNDRSAPNFNA